MTAAVLSWQLHAATPGDAEQAESARCDSTEKPVSYPERLLSDFPIIYMDTAYTAPGYHVVVRAAWIAKPGRNCKVSSPSQLPEPPGACMIRFIPAVTQPGPEKRSGESDVPH